MKKFLVLAQLIVLLTLGLSEAGNSPGTSGAPFLRIGVGARASGMGEAFTAVADDVSTIFWNPAGLANFKGREFLFMHNLWAPETSLEYVAYAQPIKDFGTLSGSLTYLWMPPLNVSDPTNPSG